MTRATAARTNVAADAEPAPAQRASAMHGDDVDPSATRTHAVCDAQEARSCVTNVGPATTTTTTANSARHHTRMVTIRR